MDIWVYAGMDKVLKSMRNRLRLVKIKNSEHNLIYVETQAKKKGYRCKITPVT